MKRNLLLWTLCAVAAFGVTGCVGTLDGRDKWGVPLRKDSISSRYERTVPQALAAARVVLGRLGQIFADDSVMLTVSARVTERYVYVRASELDPKTVQVDVQVRTKAGGTDLDLTAEIQKQIALQLAATR
jgi:hypothetical protein